MLQGNVTGLDGPGMGRGVQDDLMDTPAPKWVNRLAPLVKSYPSREAGALHCSD